MKHNKIEIKLNVVAVPNIFHLVSPKLHQTVLHSKSTQQQYCSLFPLRAQNNFAECEPESIHLFMFRFLTALQVVLC